MTVRAGSYCSPIGATDTTSKGTAMVCDIRTGNRARWGSTGSADTRRSLLKAARDAGIKVKRGLPDDEVRALIGATTTPTSTTAAPTSVDDRIRTAFHQLTPGHGDYLMLSDLRAALPDISRENFDAHLARMNQDPNVHIVPESNQKVLTQQERDGAVHIGNQAKHLISITQPLDPGARQRVTAQGVANASDADLAMAQRDPWTRSAVLDAIRAEVRTRAGNTRA